MVEALLAECHENKASATIADVAELANAVLFGRHDDRELSPKAVGAIVREQLGLTTKRTASGYIVSLNDQVKQKVHDLIAMLALPTLMPNRSCSWCNRLQNAAEISSLSSQVHQL